MNTKIRKIYLITTPQKITLTDDEIQSAIAIGLDLNRADDYQKAVDFATESLI